MAAPDSSSRVRVFFVADERWCVYECAASRTKLDVTTLAFETDGVVRRVRSYPQNWFELTDEELARLSWAR